MSWRMPGLGWWPVMAVVPLSRMTTMMSTLLKTALARPVMPEWKKVESPMKPTTVLPEPMAKPEPPETEEPMQKRKSAQRNGGSMPRV